MQYGLPYKGSKTKIANEIIDFLPPAKVLYDLFAGGCAITHAAILSGKWGKVVANDIGPWPGLFRDAAKGKYRNSYQWVSREDFFKSKDPFERLVFSFGNDCRTYIYAEGDKNENFKRALHYAICFHDYAPMKDIGGPDLSVIDSCKTMKQRRLMAYAILGGKEWYEKDIQLENLERLERLQNLERLERLQNLERLERLQNIERLEVKQGDYFDVPIDEDSVIYCFDKHTEILTDHGWKLLKDIQPEDAFFSRCPGTKELDFVRATDIFNYRYHGPMYHYQGKEVDLCVTPNHRIFCAKDYSREKIKVEQFAPAKDFFGKPGYFINAGGIWNGNNPEFFDLCGEDVPFNEFSYFLGIFVCDGSVNCQGNITITQSKQHTTEKIRNSLSVLGIKYSEYASNNNVVFYLSRKYLPFFIQFRLKSQRNIPPLFKNASVLALKRLMEGILDGDGDGKRMRITTGSASLRDDIMEIAYKIGLSSSYSELRPKVSYLASEDRYIVGKEVVYSISIKVKERISHSPREYKNETWEEYDDMVYCLTLEKWHTVLVRRNGKAIWCGQCDPPYANTNGYGAKKLSDFDSERLYDWILEQKAPVYISEYQMPEDRFECIWERKVKSLINQSGPTEATERLFVPKGRDYIKTTLF